MTLFLVAFFICCFSSLLSKETATQTELTRVGWHFGSDEPVYSAQRAVTIVLLAAVFFGMALAGIGLGLQAQSRRSASMAVALPPFATLFWLAHMIFFASVRSWGLMLACTLMLLIFAALSLFAFSAWREMRRVPPPRGLEILPADYKIPYSHYHEDPPEVRLERELEQRRQRLAVQQKELEMLEQKLKQKMQQKDE
jgi:hypothetical protein